MPTVLDLVDSIKSHLREPDEFEVSIAQLQTFINDAAYDARNSGWLLQMEDDESLTFLSNTFEYNVPASFAYIRELRVEDDSTTPSTWHEIIPDHFWAMRIDAAVPKFFFHPAWSLPVDKQLKVIGQKRPTIYTALANTIDPGMESFIRARALAYALGFTATSRPDLDVQRLNMWVNHRRDSELMLGRHPQEFRAKPSSRLVPGR